MSLAYHPFTHPIRALKLAIRRWTLGADVAHDRLPGDLPPALRPFQVGEALPWKGTMFKVGRIIGGDFPCLILVPSGRTHGEKLRRLRRLRDGMRAERDELRATARALKEGAY